MAKHTSLPKAIRRLRDEMVLTQEVFSELVGVNRLAVIKWEGGKESPSLKTLQRLVHLGLDERYLTGRWGAALPPREDVA